MSEMSIFENFLQTFSRSPAMSSPVFVSFMYFTRPFFSNVTRPIFLKYSRIFTVWEYVQSAVFAKVDA